MADGEIQLLSLRRICSGGVGGGCMFGGCGLVGNGVISSSP